MKRTSDPWTLVIGVSAANAVGIVPGAIPAFLVGGLMDDLGFSAVDAGALGTIELISIAGASILAAPFMARLSAVRVAFCGGFLTVGAHLVSALLESFWPLAVARFAAGVGEGLALAAASTTAAAARDPDRLYGFAMASFMGTMVLLTPGLAPVIEAQGIAAGYVTLGCFYLLLVPFFGWLGRAERKPVEATSEAPPLPRGQLVLVMSVMILFGLGPGPVGSFMERIGVQIGMTAERIGQFYSMAMAAGLAASILAGRLGVRFGRTRPISLVMLVQAGACLGFGFVSGELLYLGVILLFLGSYMFLNTYLFATVAVFDPAGRVGPAAVGSFMLVFGLGPMLGGALITWGSYVMLGWFAVAVLGLGALLVLAFGDFLNRLDAR